MPRDSICFGVYVDGVCVVGCNRTKVLAALEAVKVALDAAGLQCSEVEADTSKQVFTGLQLDHKTGVPPLEASRIWRLRRGLEYAARERDILRGIRWPSYWAHHLELPGASSCLVSHQCRGVVLRALSDLEAGRVWPAVAQEFRRIASFLPLLTCDLASPWSPWVYATDASGAARGGYGVTRRKCDSETGAAAGSCAQRWRFSAEELIRARRSVLVEYERRAQKHPLGLESKT